MPKKYEKPPIIEAVCEFRFSGKTKWDLTIPGLIYDLVKAEYPQKEQLRELLVDTGAKPPRGQFVDKVRFKDEDGKQFIQVAPLQISVHRLAPYLDWESFLPTIKKAFEAYRKVGEPTALSRIGVRYINGFDIPAEQVTLQNYFEFYPRLPAKLEAINFDSFINGIQFRLSDERDILKVELSSAGALAPKTIRVLLDLDYFLNKPEAIALDDAMTWVGSAHDQIESTFEACMKDTARKLLQPAKQ